MISPSLAFGNGPRKQVLLQASKKTKQLQWDKLSLNALSQTIFATGSDENEQEWIEKLKASGVLASIEDDFQAKQLAVRLASAKKKAELNSVLDAKTKERIEIIIGKRSGLPKEESQEAKSRNIVRKILAYDLSLCTADFLSEMKGLLPNPQVKSKLSLARTDDPEEMDLMHPADRFLIELIKIPHLEVRFDGMLYKEEFAEKYQTISQVSCPKVMCVFFCLD